MHREWKMIECQKMLRHYNIYDEKQKIHIKTACMCGNRGIMVEMDLWRKIGEINKNGDRRQLEKFNWLKKDVRTCSNFHK